MSAICDKCGLCCRKLIIEIDHIDVVREPKLMETATLAVPFDGVQPDSEWDRKYILARGGTRCPCPHFGADNHCGIYPTRPNICVQFQAGSEQCNELREENGLEPIQ